MARAGLRVRDAGNVILTDTTTRMGTILGVVEVGKDNGGVADPNLALGTPFWSLVSLNANWTVRQPKLTYGLVGGVPTISWSWPTSGSQFNNPCRLTYGVF
ncbi:hypothetical protein JIX59_03610 [Brevundimonas diminuta]|uniref:hypothetical protein n=1 Tax=Brevundimonas diminuta TaxID=293 RepID=UPI001904E381|nr:hypothetical protein [Brevundimonas diminuta]MBK1968419.1 hypothetical protein [Brevundimonas diminuta]